MIDYHIIPRYENRNPECVPHELVGHECWCEPRAVLYTNLMRLFLHQTHLIDIVKAPPPRSDDGAGRLDAPPPPPVARAAAIPIGPERQLTSGMAPRS